MIHDIYLVVLSVIFEIAGIVVDMRGVEFGGRELYVEFDIAT